MKITQVSYTRTFNLGNYENVKIELVADVTDQDGEAVDLVLDDLAKEAKSWVATRKGKS